VGALSLLRAAVDPGITGGAYVGPGGWQEFTGYPVVLQPSERARDLALAQRLWEESEKLTGVSYDFAAVPSVGDGDAEMTREQRGQRD